MMHKTFRQWAVVAAALALATAVSAKNPSRIQYSVDPSTTIPSATVVSRTGETVVIFKVASITAGDTFSFTMAMNPGKGADKLAYPIGANLQVIGSSQLATTFTPQEVSFDSSGSAPTSAVTVTVAAGDYSHIKRLSVKIKAIPQAGAKLGTGPGVKVVILKSSKSSASAEAGMLEDLQDALAPKPAPAKAAPQSDDPANW